MTTNSASASRFAEKHYWSLTAALLLILVLVQIGSIWKESQTSDEAVHLAAGYSYLTRGDFRMNPEHPPLAKILCALPLLLLQPQLPTHIAAWWSSDQWGFGHDFLYKNRVPADTMLFAARSVTILMTGFLAFAVARWTRQRFGATAAVLALGFITFDPNIIAHGRYVTNDLIATLFFFLTVTLWSDFLEYGGMRRLAMVAAVFGLALASKFSTLILVPILALVYLVQACQRRRVDLKRLAACVLALTLGGLFVVGLSYFRETQKILLGESITPSFLKGIDAVRTHQEQGHLSYLLGEFSPEGWWYYFIVAFAVKTPSGVLLLSLALAGIAIGALWVKGISARQMPLAAFSLVAASVIYFLGASTSRIDIGIRHLLPVYPFLYVILAASANRHKATLKLALAALVLVAVESVACYPNYLAFFNTVSGGTSNGPRYLPDSNIDWGQDLIRLKEYWEEQGKPPLCLAYFGSADVRYYGMEPGTLPIAEPKEGANCLAAISVNYLNGFWIDPGSYAWLRTHSPTDRIGGSIYVYDFRK